MCTWNVEIFCKCWEQDLLPRPLSHTHTHSYLPLSGISHHNAPALLVVLCNTHLSNILWSLNIQCLIDLIFLIKYKERAVINLKNLKIGKQATCPDVAECLINEAKMTKRITQRGVLHQSAGCSEANYIGVKYGIKHDEACCYNNQKIINHEVVGHRDPVTYKSDILL